MEEKDSQSSASTWPSPWFLSAHTKQEDTYLHEGEDVSTGGSSADMRRRGGGD